MKPVLAAIFRTLLYPFWAVQLLTGAKSFLDNPLIGSAALNRRGLHVWRLRTAARLAQRRRRKLAGLVSDADRLAFERDGYAIKREFLSPPEFSALLDGVRRYRGEAREQLQGATLTRRLACSPQTLAAIPALRRLLAHPQWRGLIRYVGSFDAEPLVYVQTVLSHARAAPPDPQEALHADTFHPTVKAWLFLTEVAAEQSCFLYVPGSHRLTPERLAWERKKSLAMSPATDRLTQRGSFRVGLEELAELKLPPPTRFAVPANTLIVADTHGFHARQASSRPACRVEIWAYGRRNPFLPWTGIDLAGLPGLRDRRVDFGWRLGDGLERLGLKPQVWRRRPDAGAFDA